MGLKYKYEAREQIPAEQHAFYVEREGAWTLDVEGAVDKAKLEELRNSHGALLKERDELKQRFAGIDPDQVRQLAEEKRKLEEAQQLKDGEFEKVLEARVRAARGELDKQLAGVKVERDALHSRLTAIQIDQAVVGEATKRGLRSSAIPDITARARQTFRLVNGIPQALAADGQTARVGRDGVTPLNLAEWIDTQVSEAPHLFESHAGGGANGQAVAGVADNPWKLESFNLTRQGQLMRQDPKQAKSLMAAARH